MVRSRCQGANTVVSSRETTGYCRLKKTLSISSIVDTLEEGELSGVKSSGGIQRRSQVLNGHVSVANNQTILKSLGSGVVGRVGVRKRTSDKVRHLN